jgi:hypothetical protein
VDKLSKSDKKLIKEEESPMKRLKPGVSPTGLPVLSGSAKDIADVLRHHAGPKVKLKPEKFSELERLAVQETKKRFDKEDISDHPKHIKEIMVRHRGVIPEGHPDREKMAAHVNSLLSSQQRGEGTRLYQQYLSGGKEYTKSESLSKTDIYAQAYSDGTLDVIFEEDVSDLLEKAVVTYLESKGYEEVLAKGLKAKHKSKKGGMTAAGVKAYRRENPGSKLQTAVTEDKPKGKRAKRRRSFCARMSGVKGPMKDKNGKPTRKALALRRWKC